MYVYKRNSQKQNITNKKFENIHNCIKMERILVYGYFNSGQKRKNEGRNEHESNLKKTKSNEIAEKQDQNAEKIMHRTGQFGKMILPNRETVDIDRKIVKSFTQKKKDQDDYEDSDIDSTEDEQKTD